MSQVAFEPTTPEFEQAKTVHTLARVATVIGDVGSNSLKYHLD
jgi:hypothetical protein